MKTNQEGLRRHFRKVAWSVVLVGLVSTVNAEPAGPASIQVPDVRANIMKMLQQAQSMETEGGEDLFVEAERQQKEKDQPSAATIEEKKEAKNPVVVPAEKPKKKAEKHVELPVKEIVIENMDDLKKLAEELRRAKKRQTGQ